MLPTPITPQDRECLPHSGNQEGSGRSDRPQCSTLSPGDDRERMLYSSERLEREEVSSTATYEAVNRYNRTEKARISKRKYWRRTQGVKTHVQRPRVFKFGYLYQPSALRLAEMLPEEDRQPGWEGWLMTPFASAVESEETGRGKCALVFLRNGSIEIGKEVVIGQTNWTSSGTLTSQSLRFAIANLVDLPADTEADVFDAFCSEHSETADLLAEQERPKRKRRKKAAA